MPSLEALLGLRIIESPLVPPDTAIIMDEPLQLRMAEMARELDRSITAEMLQQARFLICPAPISEEQRFVSKMRELLQELPSGAELNLAMDMEDGCVRYSATMAGHPRIIYALREKIDDFAPFSYWEMDAEGFHCVRFSTCFYFPRGNRVADERFVFRADERPARHLDPPDATVREESGLPCVRVPGDVSYCPPRKIQNQTAAMQDGFDAMPDDVALHRYLRIRAGKALTLAMRGKRSEEEIRELKKQFGYDA